MAWRSDEQSPFGLGTPFQPVLLPGSLLSCDYVAFAELAAAPCLVLGSLWSLWPLWFMALMGSLIVSKQLAGYRPDPGLGNNLSFVPCPEGWSYKKNKKTLQTSIFLSTRMELQNDEMVFALIYLLFPFLFLFSSFFFFLPYSHCFLLHPLLLSVPSFINLPSLCTSLLLLSPLLALFCLIFLCISFPSQMHHAFSCCA